MQPNIRLIRTAMFAKRKISRDSSYGGIWKATSPDGVVLAGVLDCSQSPIFPWDFRVSYGESV